MTFETLGKDVKNKESFMDNHGHTSLRHFDILLNVSFTLSEMTHG